MVHQERRKRDEHDENCGQTYRDPRLWASVGNAILSAARLIVDLCR